MTSNSSRKEWVVMVYLATESSLAQENVFNLTEMKRIGVRKKLSDMANVIAWLETGPGPNEGIAYRLTGPTSGDPEEPLYPSTRRYYKEGQLSENIDHDLLKHRKGECPNCRTQYLKGTTYAERIVTFAKAVMEHYDANHYALILSGHGQGWVGDFMMQGADGRTALTLPSLRETLKRIMGLEQRKKLDLLGMDSCLMSMTEVCYEVQDYAKVLIGAEGFEPLAGWPYAAVLELIENWEKGEDPEDKRLKELAEKIVQSYVTYYSDYADAGISVDQSACDLGSAGLLASKVRELSNALKAGFDRLRSDLHPFKDQVILAHWESQQYRSGQYVDLYDFCERLGSRLSDIVKRCALADWEADIRAITSACKQVMDAIAKKEAGQDTQFVLKSCFSGPLVQHSHGVSMYFPWAKSLLDLEHYKGLAFTEETGWHQFLEAYLIKTQREPRPEWGADSASRDHAHTMRIAERTALGRFGFAFRNGSFNKDVESIIGGMSNPATQYGKCKC